MRENLKTSRYRNGGSIPNVTDNTTWSNLSIGGTGAWSNYENNTSNNDIYGKLYNWYTTLGDTLCPTGWRVPTWAEYTAFTTYWGGTGYAGGKMKTTGSTYWAGENSGADNFSGFSALPGGARNPNGSFSGIRGYAYFWSATEFDSTFPWALGLISINGNVTEINHWNKSFGVSVRCLKN
jgi:uncharacterized protein (TIGR02145 family)